MTTGEGARVEIAVAGPNRRAAFDNLFQLYVHDFSEQWWDRPDGELSDEGLFAAYPHLDSYWREAGRRPLLIRADGRLAGFALLNRVGHLDRPLDWNMAEFFVARKHRRAGVGLTAAHLILTLHPGVWEIAVTRRNPGALAFWRKMAATCPRRLTTEAFDLTSPAWDGPVIRLAVGAAPADPTGQTRAGHPHRGSRDASARHRTPGAPTA